MIHEWERVARKEYDSLDALYKDFPTGTLVRWRDRHTLAEGRGRVQGVCRSLPLRPGAGAHPVALVVIVEPRCTTGHVYPMEITAKCNRNRPS